MIAKSMLAIRWMYHNSDSFHEHMIPTKASFVRVRFDEDITLMDTFVKVIAPPEPVEIIWRRSELNPRFRAHMLQLIYGVSRAHQSRYFHEYSQYQMAVTDETLVGILKLFRYPVTGGIRPTKRDTSTEQESIINDFMRMNLQRAFHETICNVKESMIPLPHYEKKITEQQEWLKTRFVDPYDPAGLNSGLACSHYPSNAEDDDVEDSQIEDEEEFQESFEEQMEESLQSYDVTL
jgi:hypothetical protein